MEVQFVVTQDQTSAAILIIDTQTNTVASVPDQSRFQSHKT